MLMFESLMRYAAFPLIAGIAVTTIIAGSEVSSSEPGPLRCGVETSQSGGMLSLEAKFVSDTAVTGNYEFRVAASGSGGSSNVSQGGGFAAGAGEVVTLGRMMLNAGSNIDLDFTISANGTRLDCGEPVEALR